MKGIPTPSATAAYNNKLGLARASAVRDFLVKYGARAAQIEVSSRGKLDPKYAGEKSTLRAYR